MDTQTNVQATPVAAEPVEQAVITPTETTTEQPKGSFLKKAKIAGAVVSVLAIVAIVLFGMRVARVYSEAEKYKTAYDITQEQFKYCEDLLAKESSKRNFDYCDEFKTRFSSVEKENK